VGQAVANRRSGKDKGVRTSPVPGEVAERG